MTNVSKTKPRTQSNPPHNRMTRETVHDACKSLVAAGRQVTRQAVTRMTGLTISAVDDHLYRLKKDLLLRLTVPGHFEMVDIFPETRAISKTVIPGGQVKLEVGDQLLALTPDEARVVGVLFAGDATQANLLHGERHIYDDVARAKKAIATMQNHLNLLIVALANSVKNKTTQDDLFGAKPPLKSLK